MSRVAADLRPFLTENRDRFLAELAEFIRIPAVSIEGGEDIRRMAERAAATCRDVGLDTRVEETSGHPVVFAQAGPDDAPFTLLTYGHYDVFPVADEPGWDTDPFEPVFRGDRIYARGAGDNKGQFLAHLNALRWWQQHAGGLPIKVKVVLEGEEENGSQHLPEFIKRNAGELAADLCVYSDGPMLPGDHPALLFGARGALVLEFESRGAASPLHSGNFGGVAVNPVLELSRLFAELIAPNGDILAPGANEGLPKPNAAEWTALRALDFDPAEFEKRTGVPPTSERFGESYYERLLYRPSFNISGFSGGHTGVGAKTLIPTSATAKVDLRLVGDQDPDAVLRAIERFIADRGFDRIAVRKLFSQPPSRTRLDHPYADLVQEAVAEGFGCTPLRVPSLAGTTPDYVFTKLLDIPTVMLPFAPTDESHHAPNESMKVSLFLGGIYTAARLVELIAEKCRSGQLPIASVQSQLGEE